MSEKELSQVPVLPLRDVVVFPHMVVPLFVGRKKSIEALEQATSGDKKILLLSQKDPDVDDPIAEDLYPIGTYATVLQFLNLPDGTVKALVEGEQRVHVNELYQEKVLEANITLIESQQVIAGHAEAYVRALNDKFDEYAKLYKKIPDEVLGSLSGIDHPGRLMDTMASHLSLTSSDKQQVLESINIQTRYEFFMGYLNNEIELLQIDAKISNRVKKQMDKNQREYFLNEKMKAIQKELGEGDGEAGELDQMEGDIKNSGMDKEAKEKAFGELKKLRQMPPMSSEASVVRGYVEWLLSMPWKKKTKLRSDLQRAQKILDDDHHGLEKVKERIIEYLAVAKRAKKHTGPILCLVGPPGVGKTSLAKSIARATNRKFTRIALGGVRDEAEIRGHRRTYIGAMPGKIVQQLKRVGVNNPLFLLDEIDKMASDYRGDPSAALLEVLDPEQNTAFNDHFMEVDIDLSNVMFVATSNSMDIPEPLLDRMEVIRLEGYTEDEKLSIAKHYLLPRQIEKHALKKGELVLEGDVLLDVIRYYTREAGVRKLEQQIAKLCRKVVTKTQIENEESIVINVDNIEDLLGVKQYRFDIAQVDNRIGQVTGLAWTRVGGELLTVEVASFAGSGKLVYTGKLGDVMKESIQAAMTVVKSRAAALGITQETLEKQDVHIHLPEGATPKDGPSAGTAISTALVSSLTGIAVRADVAMTGEITLRGEVLPIGGLKEKLLAAQRGGIKIVLIPKENEKDLAEIPEKVKKDLEIIPVSWIDEVLSVALSAPVEPIDIGESLGASSRGEPEDNIGSVQRH